MANESCPSHGQAGIYVHLAVNIFQDKSKRKLKQVLNEKILQLSAPSAQGQERLLWLIPGAACEITPRTRSALTPQLFSCNSGVFAVDLGVVLYGPRSWTQ